ncbi:hypothetical protein [Pseudonocardia broussonetiae]|uniref:Uncharacterized protein n=1 Tax=Pseudonocardia broussonetiae TaxID=2736640 RepID=A0A6M6JPQ6_9PSEU|nr:hypothetical protein [Pseudonocardia broussonetiae]QJY48947.1 hypothetical protein HOP40_26815 [Pseudonocardia broussonetiae]
MNRIALHQSTVHPLDPVGLVGLAVRAGIPSIGLRIAAVDEVEQWWSKGIGSAMLHALVPALLEARVTVLDVGRVHLGPELRVLDSSHAYTRVLELGVRLGAQFVTARAVQDSADDPAELFAVLAELAARYRLRPLMTVVPGSPVATLDRALAIVDGTTGGVVLDVSPGSQGPADVEELVVELGDALGYVRIPARELVDGGVPGLLATLPPHVAVAIGGAPTGEPEALHGVDAEVSRVAALREAVDVMLRHPRAATGH